MKVQADPKVSQLTSLYNERFEKLLLSLDEAIIDAGRKTERQKIIEDSEQFEARRELLMVEEIANKKREIQASAKNAFLLQIESKFHQALLPELELEFRNIDTIMNKILKFDSNLGRLLDILYTESCSISRIVACLENIPWLTESIMMFVKQPKYRRVDSAGRPILLKTIRASLSFIGIESLRILIPVLVAKHANPAKSAFTPDLPRNLWLYTIGCGNIGHALADKNGLRPHFGYCIGLFSNIGRSIVANLYLRTFDRMLTQQIIKARKSNNPNQAKALSALEPSHKYLISLWKKHASRITGDIISGLNCKWLTIAAGLQDCSKIREMTIAHVEQIDVHPLTKLLFNAQGFMQYKMLSKDKLIGKEESMIFLRNFGIGSNDVAIVSKVNITGIELNISGKLPDDVNSS